MNFCPQLYSQLFFSNSFSLLALSNVDKISVINRTETTLTLQWNKVDNKNYNYTLSYYSQNNSISGSVEGSVVTHKVVNLTAGTQYNFILYTVSEGVQSTGYNFTTVTSKCDLSSRALL